MTLPIPATARWSSSASPSATASRSRRRVSASSVRSSGRAGPGRAPAARAWRIELRSEAARRTGASKQTATLPLVSSTHARAPRGQPPRLARAVAVPGALHPQVGAQRGAALEADEQVLAARLDRARPARRRARQVGHAAESRRGWARAAVTTAARRARRRSTVAVRKIVSPSGMDRCVPAAGPQRPARPVGILRAPRKTRYRTRSAHA